MVRRSKKQEILKSALLFDQRLQEIISTILEQPFETLDRSKISVNEDVGAILYDNVCILVYINGIFYDGFTGIPINYD